MISKTMEAAFNKQINEELASAYIYAAMANYFDGVNLTGFSHWMRLQTDEELLHARKFRDHLIDRGGKVTLTEIAAPPNAWDSPLAAFEAAYKHECHISACIHKLSSQATSEQDHASHQFLEWFVAEQVEEEANADNIVQQLKLVEGAPGGLFLLDREMAKRPTATASGEAGA